VGWTSCLRGCREMLSGEGCAGGGGGGGRRTEGGEQGGPVGKQCCDGS